jgi:hypothetical protein
MWFVLVYLIDKFNVAPYLWKLDEMVKSYYLLHFMSLNFLTIIFDTINILIFFFFFCIWYVYMILFQIVYWKTSQWTKNFLYLIVYSGSLFSTYIWACWIIHIGSCKCASVHDIEVCLNISGRSSRECRRRVWRGVGGTIWGQRPWASQLCF